MRNRFSMLCKGHHSADYGNRMLRICFRSRTICLSGNCNNSDSIFFAGAKAYGKRCPKCRAWNSLFIAGQNLIKRDNVKVRRPLGSAYFRTSGKATFGVRQTFVSAEENTYNATIRCRICGYETKTVHTVIDDKIR